VHTSIGQIERQIDGSRLGAAWGLVVWSRHEKHANGSGHHHHHKSEHLACGEDVTLLLPSFELAVFDNHAIAATSEKVEKKQQTTMTIK